VGLGGAAGRVGSDEASAGGPDYGFDGCAEAEAVADGSSTAADRSFGQIEPPRHGVDREAGGEQAQELQVVVADLARWHAAGERSEFLGEDGHTDHLAPKRRDSAASQSAGFPCGS
jgi:hypothetical protein